MTVQLIFHIDYFLQSQKKKLRKDGIFQQPITARVNCKKVAQNIYPNPIKILAILLFILHL